MRVRIDVPVEVSEEEKELLKKLDNECSSKDGSKWKSAFRRKLGI